MKFSQPLKATKLALFTTAITLLLTPVTFAAVGVSSSELQEAAEIIIPDENSIELLEGYSSFSLQEITSTSGGIIATYKARLTEDPWYDSEIPTLQLMIVSYGDQDTAMSTFESILNANYFNATRQMHWHDERTIFYENETSSSADIFGTIQSEGQSLHMLHLNGDLIFQASLYRPSGEYNSNNMDAYTSVIQDEDSVAAILEDVIESSKLAIGILFPPAYSELSTKSDLSSVNLSELYEIPQHGNVSLDLYVSELTGAVGTILDSSGIAEADEGDLYLYLGSDGILYAGIYAPLLDADCTQQGGWYRISTGSPIFAYEWNHIDFHFGVGGFSISLNEEVVAKCSVSQARSVNNFYLGDFPGDSIEESMIGYVNDLIFTPSTTSTGLVWDDVLNEQLFLDLPNTDPDIDAFQFLKDAGIFTGSDGMLYPDQNLNRAEMVKILLKAYSYNSSEVNTSPFWDVPIDAWYLKYLAEAYEIGMVEGNPDGSFAPASYLNRAEFYMMLYRIANPGKISYDNEYFDLEGDEWYAAAAAFAASENLLDGYYFLPSYTVSRREAAQVLYNLLK